MKSWNHEIHAIYSTAQIVNEAMLLSKLCHEMMKLWDYENMKLGNCAMKSWNYEINKFWNYEIVWKVHDTMQLWNYEIRKVLTPEKDPNNDTSEHAQV